MKQPTYSFSEIVNRILNADLEEMKLLCELLNEEKKRYSLIDLKSIQKILQLQTFKKLIEK